MSRFISLITILLFSSAFLLNGEVNGQGEAKKNVNALIKGVFIYNFTKYLHWPEASIGKEFKIGVYKNAEVFAELHRLSQVKKVGKNQFKVVELDNLEGIETFQMVYFSESAPYKLKDIYSRIGKNSVLVVMDGSNEPEAMINFKVIGTRQKFELNEKEIEHQNIKVDDVIKNLAVLTTSKKDISPRINGKSKSSVDPISEEETKKQEQIEPKEELSDEEFDRLFIQMQNDLSEEKSKNKQKDQEINQLKNSIVSLESTILLRESELKIVQDRINEQSAELENISSSIGLKEKEYLNNIALAEDSKRSLEAAKVSLEKTKSKLNETSHLLNNQRLISFGTLFVLIIIGILGFIAFRNYQKQKLQSAIILEQKKEVENQKNQVEGQRDQIQHQHKELEVKNREITDSINYAKRIQEAILPPIKLVSHYLEESFVLYKPKDIVAGDFYWMETHKDQVIFAAADCTGHGVPGALVSVICSNALNRSVREYGLSKPSDILDKTLELVIERFDKSEEEVKDGMDIALCSLNIESMELEYAGAHNPLWLIRKDSNEVEEIKGNKQPIGKFADHTKFNNHKVKLSKGDSIYLFSDGYIDQFGGELGKKYKSRNFKNFLISISEKKMDTQKVLIEEEFSRWKGHEEQLDDVCVIGYRA